MNGATALDHLLPGAGNRPLSPDELAVVDLILDAAAAWQAKELPLKVFAAIGALLRNGEESARYGRFVAIRITPKDDPRRAALQAAIEELVWFDGMTATKQGLVESGGLRSKA